MNGIELISSIYTFFKLIVDNQTPTPWAKGVNESGDASSEVDPAEVRLLHCMPASLFCFKKVKILLIFTMIVVIVLWRLP